MTVTVRKEGNRWLVDWTPPGKKRRRLFFRHEADARAEKQTIELAFRHNQETWRTLNEGERYDLIELWHEAAAAGTTLRAVWDKFKALPNEGNSPSLKTVIAALKKDKTDAGRRKSYVTSLDSVLCQFARGREEVAFAKVGLEEVKAFMAGKPLNSRPTVRTRLSTLFKYGIRLGYRLDNPCARLERITVDRASPRVFTPAEAQKCLLWLKAHESRALPWFILSTFCGLRPEEADSVTKADINFAEGFVRVYSSKVRQRRAVYPKREAMALLKSAIGNRKLPLPRYARRKAIRRLRDHLGWATWPKDITRHSAASYWLADCGSAATVADMLGHSEKTLRAHYKALVTREEAKAFWAIKLSRE